MADAARYDMLISLGHVTTVLLNTWHMLRHTENVQVASCQL